MIPHRLTLVVWFVLVLLAGRAVDGKTETLPSADADRAINHTGDTRRPDASFGYFTGRIEQDTTWCGTVYVGGDVTIASAATLTLAPNTQVHFLPYHDETQGGLDLTRAELIVEGRLAAQAGGIVFRSADAGSLGADWYGLVVEQGGRADVSNAAIRDGLRCVYAKRGGFVTMDHVAFANCGKPTASEDAASLSMSRRSAQPLPALRVAEKTDRQRSKRVGQVAGKSNAETKPAEITIHIRHEHKGVVSALLEAVDEATPVTGIAELDSLAATYGLIGIYRTSGRSSGLYGYRFRLTFPPGSDVVAIAKAYGNLSYIQSVVGEAENPPVLLGHRIANGLRGIRVLGGGEHAVVRIPTKVVCGTLSGVVFTAIGFVGIASTDDGPSDSAGSVGYLLLGMYVGSAVGFPLGVSAADPYDSLPTTLLAGVIPGLAGYSLLAADQDNDRTAFLFMYVVPVIGSLIASELWRKPPQDRRVSFGLSPIPNSGLSAVTMLRF